MTSNVYRYRFEHSVNFAEVESTLDLAILACESLHGATRVRLDASFAADEEKRACAIDAGTDVGQSLCHLFTGFALREFGGDSFDVRRVDRLPSADREAVAG